MDNNLSEQTKVLIELRKYLEECSPEQLKIVKQKYIDSITRENKIFEKQKEEFEIKLDKNDRKNLLKV